MSGRGYQPGCGALTRLGIMARVCDEARDQWPGEWRRCHIGNMGQEVAEASSGTAGPEVSARGMPNEQVPEAAAPSAGAPPPGEPAAGGAALPPPANTRGTGNNKKQKCGGNTGPPHGYYEDPETGALYFVTYPVTGASWAAAYFPVLLPTAAVDEWGLRQGADHHKENLAAVKAGCKHAKEEAARVRLEKEMQLRETAELQARRERDRERQARWRRERETVQQYNKRMRHKQLQNTERYEALTLEEHSRP